MKLKEILAKMIANTGVKVDDAAIKTILENKALENIEVPDEISTKLTADLLTIESAKQNPILNAHFKSTILDGLDKEVYRAADEFSLSDDDKALLKAEQSSYKRASLLAKRVQELESAKSKATKGDKDTLTKEIEKLNLEIKTIKDTTDKTLKDKESAFEGERLNWKLDEVYNQFIPKMDAKNPAKVNRIIAREFVTDELQKKGLKIVNKEGNLSLVTKEDTEYYENNQKISVEDFVSKKLANEKLLEASNSGKQSTGSKTPPSTGKEKVNGLDVSEFMAATAE